MSKKPFIPYEWPESLYALREWMRAKGVDVDALKSERQTFWMVRTLGKQTTKFPKERGASFFPGLMKMQKSLCPKGFEPKKERYVKPEKYLPGTFGAASPVRHIDPSTYELKS